MQLVHGKAAKTTSWQKPHEIGKGRSTDSLCMQRDSRMLLSNNVSDNVVRLHAPSQMFINRGSNLIIQREDAFHPTIV